MNFKEFDFIGHEKDNVTLKFMSSDTEQLFARNVKGQKEDWIYKSCQIDYNINELGHRCKSLSNLNLENYILFLGCSNTMGIGLPLEQSFPYIVSQTLNCDYYNCSVAGTGIDVIEYNLLIWLSQIKKKPKKIIIQYPDHSRFISKNIKLENLLPYGPWETEKNITKFLINAERTYHNHARKFYIENLVKHVVSDDIQVIKIQQSALKHYDTNALFWIRGDKARDLIHPGVKSHESIAKLLIENITK